MENMLVGHVVHQVFCSNTVSNKCYTTNNVEYTYTWAVKPNGNMIDKVFTLNSEPKEARMSLIWRINKRKTDDQKNVAKWLNKTLDQYHRPTCYQADLSQQKKNQKEKKTLGNPLN